MVTERPRNTQKQWEAIIAYWDKQTPEIRAKVWFYLSGQDLGQIGNSTASMGEQAFADMIAENLILEDLYDMVEFAEQKPNARIKNPKDIRTLPVV
jgi:hypothetical protein